jgi:GT2 family glycosyltransferase
MRPDHEGARIDCSIVIPTQDRPEQVTGLLEALANLDVSGISVEIVVVNDGGNPEPLAEIDWESLGIPTRLVHGPGGGPAAARNHGAAVARGAMLVFTDDDCRPERDWLREFVRAHRHHPEALLGGATSNGLPDNRWSAASEAIVAMARRFYNHRPDGATFFPSNNMAVSAARFRRIGGFSEEYPFAAEDRELCDRWRHAGELLQDAPRARVVHEHDLSFFSFSRQHVAYGRGAWRYHRERRKRGSGRLISDTHFHLRLPKLFLHAVPAGQRLRLLVPLACWQLANVLGFALEAISGPGPADVSP